MQKFYSRRKFLTGSALTLIGISSTGCGTLLHDERVGQPRGGMDDVDWSVAGMNSIGLIFFFVPGVIAFAIDYYNGALFYPPEHCGQIENELSEQVPLKSLALPQGKISVSQIETTLSKELGAPISLRKKNVVTRQLNSMKSFWKIYDEVTLEA